MTRFTLDLLADRAIRAAEYLGYFLVPVPLLADCLLTERFPAATAATLLELAAGAAILAFSLLLSYSRKKAARIDALRRTLNEAMVHDLKNPIAAAMGNICCAIDDTIAPSKEEKTNLLKLALHSCESQISLLDSLIDTSRLEHGELVLSRRQVDTKRFLKDSLAEAAGSAAQLGVRLLESHEDPLPASFDCDPDALTRVLRNLIDNSLKYTPRGGSVSLKTRRTASGISLAVSDTGVGVAKKHIKRLFEKYYRVEGSRHVGRRGTGIGLYFSKLVVEAHGGTIRVTSRRQEGTTVDFDIPQPQAARRRSVREMTPAPRPPKEPHDPHRCVLISDDDGTIRAMLAAGLKGHIDRICSSGADGTLELIRRHHPHLLILDVNLPGTNGFLLADKIRAEAGRRNIPILFMTIHKNDRAFIDSLRSDGNFAITKPFLIGELREMVAGMTSGAAKEQEDASRWEDEGGAARPDRGSADRALSRSEAD